VRHALESTAAKRKDFTPSESVSIKRALEPEMREAARERQAAAGGSAPGKLPEAVSTGAARDKVAVFTGRSARTLDKADAIVTEAEAEPERFGKLVEDMDRTGRVNGPFKRLRIIGPDPLGRASYSVPFPPVSAGAATQPPP
jgi:hypothetical protein